MPSILFWNVQRLGYTSPNKAVIKEIVDHLHTRHGAQHAYFCEMTSDADLQDYVVYKQVAVPKRSASLKNAQLGYAGIDLDNENTIHLQDVKVDNYNTLHGQNIRYRGGNSFTKQSKRFLANCGTLNGADLYVYHANASYKSVELVPWVLNDINAKHPHQNFVLFGDLNCEPHEINLGHGLTSNDDGHTHHVRNGLTKTYDWAISNIQSLNVRKVDLTDIPSDSWCGLAACFGYKKFDPATLPDHLPILVSW